MRKLPVEVGEGLVLRWATPRDVEPMVALFIEIWDDPRGRWLHDLLRGDHPNVGYEDFTLVEDISVGKIVSFMGLISQTWTYGGVPFKCGTIEAVVTHPEYRRRGLARSQIEVLHALSDSRGELVQTIFGIPWYYRQFGYEYGLHFIGAIRIDEGDIPNLEEGERDLYNLRPVTEADTSFLKEVYDYACKRQPVAAPKSDEEWRYYLRGYSENSFASRRWLVVERSDRERVGYVQYVATGGWLWDERSHLAVFQVELKPGVGYLDAMPSILRSMVEIGRRESAKTRDKDFRGISLELGTNHPAYDASPAQGLVVDDHALYARVPDVLTFLRHIRPALEANLVGTVAEGFTGELNIDLYTIKLRFDFERGRIKTIEDTKDNTWDARFPDLVFLRLLFGHMRCGELVSAYPDCQTTPVAGTLLDCLFPSNRSNVWTGIDG